MKKLFLAASVLGFIALATPVKAQVDDKNDLKEEKIKAEKALKEKKESQVIVIRKKGDKDVSIKVEVKGDKITINGKPLEEFKDDNVTVNKKKMTMWGGGDDMMELAFDNDALAGMPLTMAGVPWPGDGKEIKRTFLGVTTNGTDDGAEITNITKGSGAEKAGLKEGDLIYKIDDAKVQSPNDLSEYITSKKPNDVVTIYFKRDGKESSAKATLGERSEKGVRTFSFSGPGQGMGKSFSYSMPAMPDMKAEDLKELARVPGIAWNNDNPFSAQDGISFMRSTRPKIGLKIQDLEEGSGVKVLDADKDSPADKAGLKKDDIITEINGKKISNTDEAREQLKPEEGKNTYTIKAKRNGTEMSFEVKIPKKLKTTNL